MSVNFENEDIERLRERLRKMPDTELLRFGQSAKFLCRDKNPRDVFRLQLNEAREEWRRRHPKPPLDESI